MLRFEEVVPGDVEALVTWLPVQSFPFHDEPRVDAAWVREKAEKGYFFGPNVKAFWVHDEALGRIALLRLFDTADVTPLIDLRVADGARGNGFGTLSLAWLVKHVFETFPDTHRVGGYTRHDNLAMRRVFDKCGFTQEAYHPKSWRVPGGPFADAVGYGLLRPESSSLPASP